MTRRTSTRRLVTTLALAAPLLLSSPASTDGGDAAGGVCEDAAGESAQRRAAASVGNAAPRVLGVVFDPPDAVASGQDLTAQPQGVDDDGDEIEWSYRWSVNGRDLAESGPLLTSDQLRRGDTIVLRVVASDGVDESEPWESEPVKVGNAPPSITSTPGPLGEDGVFRYDVTAEDPDGDDAFSFRLAEAPDGMTIGANDGALRWQPGPDLAGRHAVEVEVVDVYGGRGTQTFELELSYADEDALAAPAEPEL